MNQKLDEWTLVDADIKKTQINIEIDDGELDFNPEERVRTSSLHAAGQPKIKFEMSEEEAIEYEQR